MLSEGYCANGINQAESFMPIVRWYQPDLIIVDYKLLYHLTGEDLCRMIKSNPQTAHIGVIIISAYPRISEDARYYGPDAWICKPFSLQQVTGCVRELLSKKKIILEAEIEY